MLDKAKSYLRLLISLLLLAAILILWVKYILPPIITAKVDTMVAREWLVPLDTGKRKDWNSLLIPKEGGFLAERPAYAHMENHFHTGVDLQNRYRGGPGEPVYAVAKGKVHDVKIQAERTRVTLLHLLPNGEVVYTSYIHVAGVKVKKGRWVDSSTVIARRFNREELKKYGKIYNHLHFQVHKNRFVPEDTVRSKTRGEVAERFYDPKYIFDQHHAEAVPNWREWVKSGKISFWKLLWIVF